MLSHDLGAELCKSWGINPNECKRINIIFDATERVPYAYLTLYLNEQTINTLLKLHVRGEDGDNNPDT